MSNSPGLRGGAIGSAAPKSFSSSPNSGVPFQRTCQTACVDSFLPSSSIDFSLSRQCCESARRDLRLGDHASDCCDDARPLAKFVRELLACRVRCREFVQQKKTSRDDEICRRRFRPAERNENAASENYRR